MLDDCESPLSNNNNPAEQNHQTSKDSDKCNFTVTCAEIPELSNEQKAEITQYINLPDDRSIIANGLLSKIKSIDNYLKIPQKNNVDEATHEQIFNTMSLIKAALYSFDEYKKISMLAQQNDNREIIISKNFSYLVYQLSQFIKEIEEVLSNNIRK